MSVSIFEADIFEKKHNSSKAIYNGKDWSIPNNSFFNNDKNWENNRGQVTHTFIPHQILLLILGRFPFSLKTGRKKNSIADTFYWLYFLLTSLSLLFILINTTLGFAGFFLNWNFGESSKHLNEELEIFNNNIVPFVLFWGCLVHATVGNFSFILNRRRVVEYFQHWNKAVDFLNLEIPSSLRRFLILSNVGVFIFVITIVFFYIFK
jgi:hypothetical protein